MASSCLCRIVRCIYDCSRHKFHLEAFQHEQKLSPQNSFSKSKERNQTKHPWIQNILPQYHATYVTKPCSIIPPNKHAVVWSSLSGYCGKNLYSSNRFLSMHKNMSCKRTMKSISLNNYNDVNGITWDGIDN